VNRARSGGLRLPARLFPALLLPALLLTGCDAAEGALERLSLLRAVSQDPPERFGFGTRAPSDQIAAWSIHVYPDGTGLPAGEGTVQEGADVFARTCASCHGATGTEGPNDRLVGREPWEDAPPRTRTVGNYWGYSTTLYDYIRRAMPQNLPGSLTPDETYAVIAWILHANELIPEDAVMNATTLPAVEMPARDRFVDDDRTGGDTIR